jgi:hypothetical protein
MMFLTLILFKKEKRKKKGEIVLFSLRDARKPLFGVNYCIS